MGHVTSINKAVYFFSSSRTMLRQLVVMAWLTLYVLLYIKVCPASRQNEGFYTTLYWLQFGTMGLCTS
eukprot:2132511-Ditylum_brightwellii.AAC.1